MATKIQLRRDTSSNWAILNVTLSSGEIGFEIDTNRFKIGNGSSAWSALPYFSEAQDLSSYATTSSLNSGIVSASAAAVSFLVDSAPATLNTLNEIAAAIADDANYATTITTALGTKAPLASPTFSGTVQLGTSATLAFEGSTDNAFDTTLTVVNPTANNTITLPNASGTVALTSALSSYVTLTGTQTLTNKTLDAPVINSTPGFFSFNTYIGTSAGGTNTDSLYNTAIGYQALLSLESTVEENQQSGGYANTVVGHSAGDSITTGYNNLVLGYNSDVPTPTTLNTVVLGNSSITDLRCQDTTITAVSDVRDKTDIQDLPVGLNFINEIRPVNFEWNMRDEGQVGNRQAGFIAQEVLVVEEKYDTRNWLKAVNTDNPDQLALAPARLLPVMVKAIQELSQQVEALNNRISELES